MFIWHDFWLAGSYAQAIEKLALEISKGPQTKQLCLHNNFQKCCKSPEISPAISYHT